MGERNLYGQGLNWTVVFRHLTTILCLKSVPIMWKIFYSKFNFTCYSPNHLCSAYFSNNYQFNFLTVMTVFFEQGKFASTPTVLVTAEHMSADFKHDAASLWVENATSSSFYICLRELQNYDGLHEDIFVVYVLSFINTSVWRLLKRD